jgi:hypothetical protein
MKVSDLKYLTALAACEYQSAYEVELDEATKVVGAREIPDNVSVHFVEFDKFLSDKFDITNPEKVGEYLDTLYERGSQLSEDFDSAMAYAVDGFDEQE